MEIAKYALYIEKSAKLCYTENMNTEFENTLTYNGISFQWSNRLSIDEREIHTYHEILFGMDINAVLFMENQQKKLRGDVLLLIPKGTYHFFYIQGREKFSRLKLYFSDDVLQRTPCGRLLSDVRIIENMDENILFLLKKLRSIMEAKPCEKQGFYAYSIFLMLLSELDQSLGKERKQEADTNGELMELLRYISENLSRDLSVKALSKKMNVSASSVTHRFKKTLGISVHRYVTQRRLIYGKNLILAGNKPSKIYSDCGYQDYSSFYKAYLMFFGYPPSLEGKEISDVYE